MSKKKLNHLPRDDKKGDRWRTPPSLFRQLDESLGPFFWDACCDKNNCLVKSQKKYLSKISYEYDYLNENNIPDGSGSSMLQYKGIMDLPFNKNKMDTIFINPPYSNVTPFIQKAWNDAKHFRVVMLLKADMSTNWFNSIEDTSGRLTIHINQRDRGLSDAIQVVLNFMRPGKYDTGSQIGILHLRKRVKHYVSEEVFLEDANKYDRTNLDCPENKIYNNNWENDRHSKKPKWIETKHYKRVEDGIVAKGESNFPSMILIMDRRGNK